jgi:CheY-like chemotaxis protein
MPTVLVIDDEPAIRDALTKTLSDDGWTVVSARDGAEGLERLRSGPAPVAIVLDVMMPLMSGQEFMDALRHDPDHLGLPVIQISAGAAAAIPGVAARLDKPFRTERLLHLLRTFATARDGPPSLSGLRPARRDG